MGGVCPQPHRNLSVERSFHQKKREQNLSDVESIEILDRPNFQWNGAFKEALLTKGTLSSALPPISSGSPPYD